MVDLPPTLVCSADEARAFLCRKDVVLAGVLSIGDAETEVPVWYQNLLGTLKLRLHFDDIEKPRLPSGFVGPTMKEVARGVEFLRALVAGSDKGTRLIHCGAGISRSSAFAVVAETLVAGDPAVAVDQMRTYVDLAVSSGVRLDNFIRPNRRIVYYADRHLGLDGRLMRAVGAAFSYSRPYTHEE